MDDDLKSLLEQLDIKDITSIPDIPEIQANQPKSAKIKTKKHGSDEGKPQPEPITEPVEEQQAKESPLQGELIKPSEPESESLAAISELSNEAAVTDDRQTKYLAKLDDVTDEILAACRSDRAEAQDVIQLLRGEINKALQNNRDPARMYVDGLVTAVEVKSNINMSMIKMMEANAKMLASLKAANNLNIKNNINVASSNDKELERILDEPITEVDDY